MDALRKAEVALSNPLRCASSVRRGPVTDDEEQLGSVGLRLWPSPAAALPDIALPLDQRRTRGGQGLSDARKS